MLAVLAVSLLFGERPQAFQHRAVVYVAVAFVVYLGARVGTLGPHVLELVDVFYYGTVALALAVAIRYSSDDVFRLTPMDYLVALGVLLVGAASGGHLAGSAIAPMLVKVIILFYAVEWLISRTSRRWNTLFLSVMGALLILGVRGFL